MSLRFKATTCRLICILNADWLFTSGRGPESELYVGCRSTGEDRSLPGAVRSRTSVRCTIICERFDLRGQDIRLSGNCPP